MLTNRPLRSGWADDDAAPALPLARGLKLYVEGIDPEVAGRYGEVVATPEEADAAILRLQAPFEQRDTMFENFFHAGSLEYPAEVLDHVQRVAGTVPTVVDVFADRPAILEPIVESAVAVTAQLGRERRGAARRAHRCGRSRRAGCRSTCRVRWPRSRHPAPTCRSTRTTRCSASGTA